MNHCRVLHPLQLQKASRDLQSFQKGELVSTIYKRYRQLVWVSNHFWAVLRVSTPLQPVLQRLVSKPLCWKMTTSETQIIASCSQNVAPCNISACVATTILQQVSKTPLRVLLHGELHWVKAPWLWLIILSPNQGFIQSHWIHCQHRWRQLSQTGKWSIWQIQGGCSFPCCGS